MLVDCLFITRLSDVLCAGLRKIRESAALSLRLFGPELNRRTSWSAKLGESHGTSESLLRLVNDPAIQTLSAPDATQVPGLKHAGAWARSENHITAWRIKNSLGSVETSPI